MATRIKFRSEGFRAILTGQGVRGAVVKAAQGIAAQVPGATVRVIQGGYGGGRVVAFVRTNPTTPEEGAKQLAALESAIH